MRIVEFRLTRFQFARDRVIGDSQVRADEVNIAALELIDESGRVGLGFMQSLFRPASRFQRNRRIFDSEVWPSLVEQPPLGMVHRVNRPRGGNQRASAYHSTKRSRWRFGTSRPSRSVSRCTGYSAAGAIACGPMRQGLDFHLSDSEYTEFFGHAASARLRRLQDQGRPPGFRARPASPRAAAVRPWASARW